MGEIYVERDRAPKKKKSRAGPSDPGKAPTRASLHEAALGYLARAAASGDSVTKTLERRTMAWARRAKRAGRDAELVATQAAAARALIPEVIARLREVGLVNDGAFAEARAKAMARQGRSRRAISAHLAQKGVDAAIVREAAPHDAGTELTAALAFARKRRLGPFARDEEATDREAKRAIEKKALGALGRAGFDWSVCERVMRMDRAAAEEKLRESREF